MTLLEAADAMEAYAKEWLSKRSYAVELPETVSEMPLTDTQRRIVIMHMARTIWRMALKLGADGHCKSYDPLTIDGDTAHSYVLNMHDGGRHHSFESLEQLEKDVVAEFTTWFQVGEFDALEMPIQKMMGAAFDRENGETVIEGTVEQMKMEA